MEEKQYTSLTVPTDYLQHWYQSTEHLEHIEPLQTAQYQQMTNATHLMESLGEERVMTELAVPQDPDCHLEVDSHLETDCNLEPDSHLQPNPHLHPDSHLHPDLHLPSDLHLQPDSHLLSDSHLQPDSHPAPEQAPRKGKRGRPPGKSSKAKQMLSEPQAKVPRKTDRFNGMSVAEVMAKTLPDILTYNLDILIIGINPGLMSAYKGRHYPNPGNHFWKCLFLSGLTEVQLNHMHDQTLPEKYGIGFTNMVERTTPGSKDLSSKEFREGGRLLVEKLKKYKPLIAVFNGKCIYDIFSKEIFGVKAKNLQFGIQPHKIPDTETVCYLMPSSSARCAQFPRAQDKVHFYIKLRELRDQLKGVSQNQEVQEMDYSFDVGMAKEDSKRIKIKEEQEDPRYDAAFGPTCGEEEPETSGRHCDFSFPETPQSTEVPIKQELLPDALGWAPEERWMMQSFADQIPDISGSGAQTQLWAKSI